MIDYIAYGKWEPNPKYEIRCTCCGGEIEEGAWLWTIEYNDGDQFNYHDACIKARTNPLLVFFLSQSHAVTRYYGDEDGKDNSSQH